MKNKTLINIGIVILLLIVGYTILTSYKTSNVEAPTDVQNEQEVGEQQPTGVTLQDGQNTITNVTPDQIVDLSQSTEPVKNIKMTSFSDLTGERPAPQFSIKEITVKKGDKVKINVTVTSGKHNFNIDEYNIHKDTPLDVPVDIEFTADKAGRFIYYCSMPGHRALGHWGVLNVVE